MTTIKHLTAVTATLLFAACQSDNNNSKTIASESEEITSEIDVSDSLALSAQSNPENLVSVKFNWKDSGRVIDGKGKAFNDGRRTMVEFNSEFVDGKWLYPENITFKNWKLNGVIRITGVGPSSDTDLVKKSSHRLGHTERMRKSAPRKIILQNLLIETDYKIPVVFAPGVHESVFENSIIRGESRSVAMYIDAESGHNVIRNNIFDIAASREVIAVDGSAANVVEDNIFLNTKKGGVHIYRNSGERGVVRHQEPRFNLIKGNYFSGSDMTAGGAVFLGSRNGSNPNYRHDDDEFDFGSGASNKDFAQDNTVRHNRFFGEAKTAEKHFLRSTEPNNKVAENLRVTKISGVEKIMNKFEVAFVMPPLKDVVTANTSSVKK